MAPRKKTESQHKHGPVSPNAVIENAGVMVEQPITETLEKNYMPYAMSVILSRAIPEIDGLALSVFATQIHLSQRERPWQRDEVYVDCQGLPLWGSCRAKRG